MQMIAKAAMVLAAGWFALAWGGLAAAMDGNMTGTAGAKTGAAASAGGISGKIVAMDTARKTVTLAHEAIKVLGWPPMTMEFGVADGQLNGLRLGDAVVFSLAQTADGHWQVTRLAKRERGE